MDLVGLEYFISAADHRNFTKAAEQFRITQTAMSLHIAKMEKELGFPLFYRRNRTVELTPAGSVYAKECKRIVRQHEDAVQLSRNAAIGLEGRIKIAYGSFLERSILPQSIRKFRQVYPQIDIVICKNDQQNMAEELRQGMCDLAVLLPYELEDLDDIRTEPLAHFEISVFLPSGHCLGAASSLCIDDLRNETVIICNEAASPRLYQLIQRDWICGNFSPERVIEADCLESMLLLVEAGLGIAFMPVFMHQLVQGSIESVPLKDSGEGVRLSAAYLSSNQNPSLELFVQQLRSWDRQIPACSDLD